MAATHCLSNPSGCPLLHASLARLPAMQLSCKFCNVCLPTTPMPAHQHGARTPAPCLLPMHSCLLVVSDIRSTCQDKHVQSSGGPCCPTSLCTDSRTAFCARRTGRWWAVGPLAPPAQSPLRWVHADGPCLATPTTPSPPTHMSGKCCEQVRLIHEQQAASRSLLARQHQHFVYHKVPSAWIAHTIIGKRNACVLRAPHLDVLCHALKKHSASAPCSVLSAAGKWKKLGGPIARSRDFSVAEDADTGTTYMSSAEIGPPGLR